MTSHPNDELNKIIEQGLCIGCGLCQSLAPDRIAMEASADGDLYPQIKNDLTPELVKQIYAVCPGTHVEGLPESLRTDASKIDNVWGVWQRMVIGYAANPKVRYEASTGGVLTALALYLLESKRVDFILHAKASQTNPSFGEQQISLTETQIRTDTGSRYGPTAILVNLEEILERKQNFAFIGKPCDIGALRNYAQIDERVNRYVKYWLTPVCGGYMATANMKNALENFNIAFDDVTSLRYRGFGCPGATRVETKDGTVREYHYLDFWGDDDSQWGLPFRCKICPDGIGESADIAASDTWVGGGPRREETDDDLGSNGIIIRTQKGNELIEDAVRDGYLCLGDELVPDDMSHYQPHQLHKKYAVWARYQGMEEAGNIVPETKNLRLKTLSDELPQSYVEQQKQGTMERIMRLRKTAS